ncbi:MAG TPA: tyrosine-protein phosphatase [Bacillota bacterium]|nr:tyrosine-protein phosphatase [Bacillota bacterium]
MKVDIDDILHTSLSKLNMEVRYTPLDGPTNFRDVGGLTTQDGRRMRTGLFYRSDELSRLSKRDLGILQGFKIKVVCDLRTPNERRSRMDRILEKDGVRILSMPIYHLERDYTPFEYLKLLMNKTEELNFEAIIKELYQRMIYDAANSIREVFTLLAEEPNRPAIIHCTGGKDRTGYLSALIQLLAGVPREIVLEDYLFSNMVIQQKMKKAAKLIRWVSLFQITPDRLRPMLEVRAEYLNEILDEVFKRYGNVETYLREVCGVEQTSLDRLKEVIVER